MKQFQILNSKLLVPNIEGTLQRERLFTLFHEILSHRVISVTAAAGYGKTVMTAQAIAFLNVKAVWYQLDEYDNDLHVFLRYIIKGFNIHWPRFEDRMLPLMDQNPTSDREIRLLLSNLLIEIENSLDEDVLMVLDDYHCVLDNEAINTAVYFILSRLPVKLHFVIISRKNPAQSDKLNMSLLRSRQHLLEINETDIGFSTEELHKVLDKLFNYTPSEAELKTIYAKSGGWITGLILCLPFTRYEVVDDDFSSFEELSKNAFQYFEINVISQLPDEIVDFLLKTSCLTEIETDLCNYLFDIDNAGYILSFLVNHRIFTTSFYEKKHFFRYHQLFQDFLQHRFKETFSKEERRKFHYKIANKFEKIDHNEEALEHYMRAGRPIDIVRLLDKIGYQLLLEGRLRKVIECINSVPKEYLGKSANLTFLKAKIKSQEGDFFGAVDGYNKALKIFRSNNDVKGELICLELLGYLNVVSGNLKKAQQILNHTLPKLESQPEIKKIALGRLSFISSFLGNFKVSDEYVHEGFRSLGALKGKKEANARANLIMAQSLRNLWSGDYGRAIRQASELKNLCREFNIAELLPFAYNLLAKTYYNVGEYQTGYEMGSVGVLEAERFGLKDTFHAWPLQGVAFNLLGLDRIDESIEVGDRSLRTFQSLNHTFGEARALQQLHSSWCKKGNYEQAFELLNSALAVVEKVTLPLIEGGLKRDAAVLLIQKSNFKEATALINKACQLLISSKYEYAKALRSFAYLEWSQNNISRSLALFQESLEICIKNEYDSWLDKESHWISPMVDVFQNHPHLNKPQKKYLEAIIAENRLSKKEPTKYSKNQSNANRSLPAPLTNREIEVLQMVAAGLTNTEISNTLHISSHTVKSHIINIFNKLGVNDRTQAAVWAVQNKLF